jgi:hypothetical protein
MGNAKPGMRFCVQGIGPTPGLIKNSPSKGNILYDLHDPVVNYFHPITLSHQQILRFQQMGMQQFYNYCERNQGVNLMWFFSVLHRADVVLCSIPLYIPGK